MFEWAICVIFEFLRPKNHKHDTSNKITRDVVLTLCGTQKSPFWFHASIGYKKCKISNIRRLDTKEP